MTGLEPEFRLEDKWRNLKTFLPHACQLNRQNCRPMQSRTLPVDWVTDGWYMIVEQKANVLVIECRAWEKKAELTHGDLQISATKDLSKFKIKQNF